MSQWPVYPDDSSDPSGQPLGGVGPDAVPPDGAQNVVPRVPEPTNWTVMPFGASVPQSDPPSTWEKVGDVIEDAVTRLFTPSPEVPDPSLPIFAEAPGYDPRAPILFSASGSQTLRKSGEWVVPPYMAIRGGMGTVVLDMQRATAATDVLRITVRGRTGSIVVVVPDGWAADLTGLSARWGTRTSTVSEKQLAGYPILVFTGTLSSGGFRVRYPNRWDRWRRKREEKREQEILRRAYR